MLLSHRGGSARNGPRDAIFAPASYACFVEPLPPVPAQLAPSPDFRYVGLEVGAPRVLRAWVGILGAGALVGAFLRGPVGAAVGLGLVGATSALAHVLGGQGSPRRAQQKSMVLAPW